MQTSQLADIFQPKVYIPLPHPVTIIKGSESVFDYGLTLAPFFCMIALYLSGLLQRFMEKVPCTSGL